MRRRMTRFVCFGPISLRLLEPNHPECMLTCNPTVPDHLHDERGRFRCDQSKLRQLRSEDAANELGYPRVSQPDEHFEPSADSTDRPSEMFERRRLRDSTRTPPRMGAIPRLTCTCSAARGCLEGMYLPSVQARRFSEADQDRLRSRQRRLMRRFAGAMRVSPPPLKPRPSERVLTYRPTVLVHLRNGRGRFREGPTRLKKFAQTRFSLRSDMQPPSPAVYEPPSRAAASDEV